ncbi:MAG TPA: GNAT family N-acetyltransferase [Rugosimonospora sp.]
MDPRIRRHLAHWLGQWPATADLSVVGSTRRQQPGWDGAIHPLIGVRAVQGTVLSVAPDRLGEVRRLTGAATSGEELLAGLPATVGQPEGTVYTGVFRWSNRPAALEDAGTWVDSSDPVVPDWLRVFGHQVLVATDPDTGGYLAGVGLKRHNQYGHELAVGTEPAARGRGLARRLVAQAARRVLDEGAVPTYQHAPDNHASARVADAAGFPDRGWTSMGIGAAEAPTRIVRT